MDLTREQVIAYRIAVQGLHRDAARVGDLGVLDLGLQDGGAGHPPAVILAARLADAELARDVPIGPGHHLALAWTFRGAPHVHRRSDLDRVGRALRPLSEADATARMFETPKSVARDGIAALEQYEIAVAAMRDVVRKPMVKGDVSTAVTKQLPKVMRRECRPCGTSHINDGAMRLAAPGAGLEIQPATSPPVLQRRAKAKLPTRADPKAVASIALAYLTFLGPAGDGEVAGFLGARRADVRDAWPDGLVEVRAAGKKRWLPGGIDVAASPPAELVRLLSPYDPYLQARDRDLIVPDKALHKKLWPVLGRPGALLVDGEIVGTWRTRSTSKRLSVTVDAGRLPKKTWTSIEDEAQHVATARGFADVAVARAD